MKPPGTVQVSRGDRGARVAPGPALKDGAAQGTCDARHLLRPVLTTPVTLSTVCFLGWPGPSSPQGPLGTRSSTKPNLQSRVPGTLRTLHGHPRVAIMPEPRHVLSSGG